MSSENFGRTFHTCLIAFARGNGIPKGYHPFNIFDIRLNLPPYVFLELMPLVLYWAGVWRFWWWLQPVNVVKLKKLSMSWDVCFGSIKWLSSGNPMSASIDMVEVSIEDLSIERSSHNTLKNSYYSDTMKAYATPHTLKWHHTYASPDCSGTTQAYVIPHCNGTLWAILAHIAMAPSDFMLVLPHTHCNDPTWSNASLHCTGSTQAYTTPHCNGPTRSNASPHCNGSTQAYSNPHCNGTTQTYASPHCNGTTQTYASPHCNGTTQAYASPYCNGTTQAYASPHCNGTTQAYSRPQCSGTRQAYDRPYCNGTTPAYDRPHCNDTTQAYVSPHCNDTTQAYAIPHAVAPGKLMIAHMQWH